MNQREFLAQCEREHRPMFKIMQRRKLIARVQRALVYLTLLIVSGTSFASFGFLAAHSNGIFSVLSTIVALLSIGLMLLFLFAFLDEIFYPADDPRRMTS